MARLSDVDLTVMKTIVDNNREVLLDPVGTRVVSSFVMAAAWTYV